MTASAYGAKRQQDGTNQDSDRPGHQSLRGSAVGDPASDGQADKSADAEQCQYRGNPDLGDTGDVGQECSEVVERDHVGGAQDGDGVDDPQLRSSDGTEFTPHTRFRARALACCRQREEDGEGAENREDDHYPESAPPSCEVTDQRAGRSTCGHREAEPADDDAGGTGGAVGCDQADRGDCRNRKESGIGETAEEAGANQYRVAVGEKTGCHGYGEDGLGGDERGSSRPVQGQDDKVMCRSSAMAGSTPATRNSALPMANRQKARR